MATTSRASMSRNVVWNITEVVASAAALFLTYRMVLQQLGVEALGLWSLVGAVVALSRFADVGVSAGLPSRMAAGGTGGPTVRQWILTALVLNTLSYAGLALMIWSLGSVALSRSGTSELMAATDLLGYCATAFALAGIAGTMGFALIGLRRSDLKSLLVIAGSAVQLVIALLLIPELGLVGLAVAQIVQSLLYTAVGFIVVLRFTREKVRLQILCLVDFSAARELFAFGLKIQTLNLSAFLYEPLTRFMIAYVGGLHLLGLYELASRIVAQARQLAIVPASNLLAVFGAHTTTQGLRASYERAFLITTAAGAVLMFAVAVLAPAVSLLWLGHLDWEFLAITCTLAIGWGVNISSAAAYYLGIAQNRLQWNVIGAVVAAFTSPVLVYFASLISPAAIGLGTCIAVSLGALITLRTAAYPAKRGTASKRLVARSRLLFQQAMSRSRLSAGNLYLALGRRATVK